MSNIDDARFLSALKNDYGYLAPRPIGNGRWAAVLPFIFTSAIVIGRMGCWETYNDRWCYHDKLDALRALGAWDGVGEPEGWHRHPATGRRRTEGNPATEYVNP